MRRTLAMATIAASLAALAAGPAQAGPQYVDASGFAASGYDVVAYFDAPPPAPGQSGPPPTPGRADITAEWNGANWAFASAANRDRFLTDPAAYAPAYDGHCAFGVAKGGKVPGDPQLWRIVDGQLYLNLDTSVQEMWLDDEPGNIVDAEANWPDLESDAASRSPVPELTPGAAPIN